MNVRYSDRYRTNYLAIAPDEHPTVEEVFHVGQMHSATKSCCGGRLKIAVAFDTADGPAREQFIQRDALNRFLRRRASSPK